MPDVDALTKQFNPFFRRDRMLQQEPASGTPQSAPPDTVTRTQTVRENFTKVETKARGILDEAERLAVTRSIPVPTDATTVRAAVQRQDPESQGLRITFDLYRKAYDYIQREGQALPLSVLDELNGDPATDRVRVARRIREITDDITVEAAELLGDQIVTLFVLKLLQLGMDSLSDGAQSATKAPPGLELPVIALQIATSVAAQQLYTGLNEDQARAALEQLGADVPIPALNLQAAREQLAKTPLFQTALLQRRPNDYRVIFDFTQAFLNRQTEPGWETWQLTPELHGLVESCVQAGTQLDRYATIEPRERATLDDPMSALQQAVSIDVQITDGQTLQPSNVMLDLYQRNLDSINVAVDQMAYLLGDTLSVQDLCCILKWAGALGDQPIRLVRTLLDIEQNTQLNLPLTSASANVQLSFSAIMHQQAMMLLHDLEETVVQRVKAWLGQTPERWQSLFESCKLIDELIEFVLRSIESLEAHLLSFLNKWLGHIEDREARLNTKLDQAGQQKRIRFLMLTLDQYLEFGVEGGICPDTPGEPVQIAQAAERVLSNVGPAIELPSIGGSPYETLTTPPLRLSTDVVMPSPPGATAGQTLLELAQGVCRSGDVSQNIVEFPRG